MLFRVAASINSGDTEWGSKRLVITISSKGLQLCIWTFIFLEHRNCNVLDSLVDFPVLIKAHCQ